MKPRRRQIVLLRGYPTLERALRNALGPWKMRVEVLDREAPGSSMPSSSIRARELVEELGADALVWISTAPDGTALWVEDARTSNLTTRAIADPPFGEPLAAALALSVKTILGLSGLAPPEHADATSDLPGQESLAPPGSEDLEPEANPPSTPEPTEASATPLPAPARAPERPLSAPASRSTPAASTQLLLLGAARFGTFRPRETGARYGLELRWFPWADAERSERLFWCGAGLETSTPWSVARPDFRGQYWDVAPGIAAGVAGNATPGLYLGANVRVALHRVSLAGTRLDDQTKVERLRVSPSILARPEVGWRLGSAILLLQPALGVSPLRLVYEQAGTRVLEARWLWWTVGGALALEWR